MRDELLREFARFRRRDARMRAWDRFLEAAFVLTLTAAGALLVDRLAFELGLSAPFLSAHVPAVLGAALAAAALWGAAAAFRPAPPARLAWEVDRASRGDERFLSALEVAVSGGGGPFADALCRDAVRVARDTPAERVVPPPSLGYRWAVLLALAAGGVLHALPARIYGAPSAAFEAFPVRGPAPLEVSFRDASNGAIREFRWDFGDGGADRGEEVVHAYEAPGRYRAVLRLEGPAGVSEASVEIEVLPADRVSADFRGEPLKGRGSLAVRFESLARNARKLAWDFGDGAVSAEDEPVHHYEAPGHYTVKLRAENDLGADEAVKERYVKVAHPDEPLADFRAMPRRGPAPLEVGFEDLSSGLVEEWHWDFGDLHASSGRTSLERNPVHVYRVPGRYTVRLRVKGPKGEDVEEKKAYVEVGEGGGGGDGAQPKPKPKPKPKSGEAAGAKGKQGPSERPKVNLMPEELKTNPKAGAPLVEKDVNVYRPPPPGTPGAAEQVPLDAVLPEYRRAAEDSMERERIPGALREHLRRYYEGLRAK
jgi:PKD repeat protein